MARRLVHGYLTDFDELVGLCSAGEILEVGCGEGYLARRLAATCSKVRAVDISYEIVAQAQSLTRSNERNRLCFSATSLYDLNPDLDSAELVVCCEVLEHVDDPEKAFERLAALANPFLLVSVPREPLWRVLNLMRGKYWSSLGNTPGHLQHWSQRAFLDMLQTRMELVAVRTPIPWTMALCRHGK
ncbi:MAG TPA: class I SAM-dependent methyltransferase [Gammaproteobacteria bacterium]|nr:class I SAM-dependent methyltransferase [Gammaproteobacteria bacterium]